MENQKEKEYRRAIRVDWMIDHLEKARSISVPTKQGSCSISPKTIVGPDYFNNAVVLFGTAGEFDSQTDLYFGDVKLSDLPPTWDVTIVRFAGQVEHDATTVFTRVRRLPLKAFREFSNMEAAFEVAQYAPGHENVAWAAGARVFWGLNGGRLRRIESPDNPLSHYNHKTAPERAADSEYGLLELARSVAFTQHYQWMVRFRNRTGYSLRLPVHPLSIPLLFQLREKHSTWTRRKALKHWVSQHWRKIKEEDSWDVMTYVRDHLRGQREFEWFGLDGKIIIPPAELKLLERLKKDRIAMREATPRTDRAVR